MKRFGIVFLVFIILVSVLAVSCKKKEQEQFVLKVGYGGSLCEAPVHAAYEFGFFEEEGLNIELIRLASGAAFDALTAGRIDASFALLAAIIQPLGNGLPAKITTGLHTGCDIVLVKPDSDINRVEDLRGKRIGIPSMTGSPSVYTKRVLADHGVDIRVEALEVEFIIYSVTDLPIVLANGSVDAIAMNEPTATIAANEYGYRILLDSAVDEPYKDQYCCVGYVSSRLAERHPDIAEKYTRALQRASAFVHNNLEEITRVQVEKNYVAGNAEVNAVVLSKFKYIPSVSGAYEAFGITAPQLQEIGMLSTDINTDALQRNSFAFFDGLDAEFR